MLKKIFIITFFILLILFVYKIDYGYVVWEIKSPGEIFVDLNKNLVYDEEKLVIIPNLYYINTKTDYSKHPILNVLNEDEKFFLEYMAKDTANDFLKNHYVKLKDNDIFINNKSYSGQMLSSKFFFSDDEITQKALIDNIKTINLDDYVIVNLKNKKYHKLNCESAKKSLRYKIIKNSELTKDMSPCKSCILKSKEQQNSYLKNRTENPNLKTDFINPNIKIFFIDLNKIFHPDNSCRENACKALKQEIDMAAKTIDYAVYGINNQPKIIDALINAQKRGVKIRRVYDYSPKKYYQDNDKLDNIIKNFKTDEHYDKTINSGLMHNKYFIFDDKKVWTGSSNISSTDLSGFNTNYNVLITSEEIAAKYKEDFEQMYNGIFHKGKKSSSGNFIEISPEIKIKPMFSPQDNIIYSQLIPLINNASKYIYISIFFLTHKDIKDALIKAHSRKVEIKIINDALNAHSNYTIHNNLRAAGIKVKTENYAGKMHSKMIIIDDKYTMLGSMNYTKSANSYNDENIIVIENKDIAEYMKSTFKYLWNKIPSKYETFDPKAESQESLGSCDDGIDNDFDDKIDDKDEGCIFGHI